MTKSDFQNSFKDKKTNDLIVLILKLSEIANTSNKLLIIQGGFAVDLAYGEQTRFHDDLDLITLEGELDFFRDEVRTLGYKIIPHDTKELSFSAENHENNTHLDIDSILIDLSLDEVTDFDEPYRYIWPVKASELIQEVEIDGVKVKYANPSLVKKFKEMQISKGKEKRAKEDHDFKILDELINKD